MACRKNIIGKIQPQYKKIPRMIYDKDTGSEVLANKNKILIYYINPALFKSADELGTLPLNFLYKIIGCSVPPLESILS